MGSCSETLPNCSSDVLGIVKKKCEEREVASISGLMAGVRCI